MAHLNVRERRMETKIAYVGAKLAGKATNLRHLKSASTHGHSTDLQIGEDTLSIEWRPIHLDSFDDCDVAVTLVAAKGAPSTDRLDRVLEDADGLVVVVDSAPSARDESARILALVREALSRGSARPIPVVVQANKVDLPDALPLQEIVGAPDWPIVAASATRGEGVVETLEVALRKVLEAMTKRPTGRAAATATADNPLLSALRDILRETVAEHVADVERKIVERITASLPATVARSEQLLSELRTMVMMTSKETARGLASQEATLSSLAGSTAEVRRGNADLAVRIDGLTTRQERLEEGLATVEARLDSLAASVASLAGMSARIAALEATLQREVRDRVQPRLVHIEDAVQSLHVDTGESMHRADARATEIQAGLNELLDELKKRKKGWFS